MAPDHDYLSPDHLPHIDSHSDLGNLGQIEVNDPTVSLGGDGHLDTETINDGDEIVIASDLNHDGYADQLKVVDSDGQYSSWEYHHDGSGDHWVQTDHGKLS